MSSPWIVIADASGARIFTSGGRNRPLELVRELANPDGRARTHDLVSDGPGRVTKSGAGGARSATDPHTDAHQEAIERFAHQLAATLREQLNLGAYTSLVIAAPPHFLGMLRERLGKEVSQRLLATLARDLIHLPIHELEAHRDSLLPAGAFS